MQTKTKSRGPTSSNNSPTQQTQPGSIARSKGQAQQPISLRSIPLSSNPPMMQAQAGFPNSNPNATADSPIDFLHRSPTTVARNITTVHHRGRHSGRQNFLTRVSAIARRKSTRPLHQQHTCQSLKFTAKHLWDIVVFGTYSILARARNRLAHDTHTTTRALRL